MQSPSGSIIRATDGIEDASRDLELVAAAKAGSSAAFEELENRHSRRLYRRIHSMTKNHEDAEDALQDTFLRAYLALDSFEARSRFSTWLTRIAINSALMVLRRRRSRAEVSFERPSESGETAVICDVLSTALNPEQLHVLRQGAEVALRAISRLDFKLRAPMAVWLEEECSMKEVAQTLDLSLATVKARLFRARKRLKGSGGFKKQDVSGDPKSGLKRKYVLVGPQNRELACLSCD